MIFVSPSNSITVRDLNFVAAPPSTREQNKYQTKTEYNKDIRASLKNLSSELTSSDFP